MKITVNGCPQTLPAAPTLLELVNAAPAVQTEALPYLRIMFMFSSGMLVFFMLGGALRSAGDARTPLRLGVIVALMGVGLALDRPLNLLSRASWRTWATTWRVIGITVGQSVTASVAAAAPAADVDADIDADDEGQI